MHHERMQPICATNMTQNCVTYKSATQFHNKKNAIFPIANVDSVTPVVLSDPLV
jgi:hypothetical protein